MGHDTNGPALAATSPNRPVTAEYVDGLNMEYLGLAQAFAILGDPGDGAKVFSLLRDSDFSPEEYLAAFFETGDERQGARDSPESSTAASPGI